MSEHPSSFVEMVHACEAAICRIRAAICAEDSDTADVSADVEFIRQAVTPYFARHARKIQGLGPEAEEEAKQAMLDQLHDHIISPTYPSLETWFGSYLKCTAHRATKKTQRHFVSFEQNHVRLDTDQDNEGYKPCEIVADLQAEAAFTSILDRMAWQNAMTQLSDIERQAVTLIMAGYTNNEVAQQLAISPSKATRVHQRAAVHIRQILHDADE